MTRPLSWIVLAAAVLAMAYWGGCWSERDRWTDRLAVVEAQLAGRDSVIVRLRADSTVLANRFAAKTDTFLKWKDRWRTIVEADTQWVKGDSVPYPVYVNVVRTGDSTIKACEATLSACVEQRLNAEAKAAAFEKNTEDLKRLLAKPKPIVTPERVGLAAIAAAAVTCLLTKVC